MFYLNRTEIPIRHYIDHAGWLGEKEISLDDVNELLQEGLLVHRQDCHPLRAVSVTARGFNYYSQLKRRIVGPIRQIETEIQQYLDAEDFRHRYPDAYGKWARAMERLWRSDAERELTGIGHDCREAMQAFVTRLVELCEPVDVDSDKALDRARLKAVLDQRKPQLGKTKWEVLDALYNYWGALSALVQRQEHGAQREGEALTWEDGRRVVFQTAFIMFEIDRILCLERK